MTDPRAPLRIITLKELQRRIPFSRSHIYRLEAAGRFPKRVKLGEHRVGWLEHEIDDWLEARLDERD